jgi:HEAT repeats
MADEPPEFLRGLPVLFFYEDPEEKRLRVEGAKPAPSSVWLPRLGAAAQPGAAELEYPLIQFPWEPWAAGLETQSLARAYASWLNETAPGRLAVIGPLLAQAGAPVAGLRDDPATLAGLGRWVQQLFPLLAAELIDQGFLRDDPWYRLGRAFRGRSPRSQRYSRYLDALIGSVAHDLAFIVADCARAVRPDLAWQPDFDTAYQSFLVGIDPGPPLSDLIGQIAEFLVQSPARPRGARGHDLRDWYGLTLLRGYQRAAHGTVTADLGQVFPEATTVRGHPRRDISRPARSDPAAPAELVAAVDVLRAAGWFEAVKFASPDLARAARAAWRRYEGSDIPSAPGEMFWRLLVLDAGRTWSDDVDAGVRPYDGIYKHLVGEVSYVRGKALGWLRDAEEDWASRPGDLVLSFRSRGGRHRLVIPSPGRYLSAALFTGLNELAQADDPRMWFVDQGPPIAIVTRATAAERAALQAVTGLRLDPDPPLWWTSLAPLPDRQHNDPPIASARPRCTSRGRAPAPAGAVGPDVSAPAARGRSTASRGSASDREGQTAGASPVTAQTAFARLMRDLVAPALHELGFTGKGPRWFAYRSGDYEAAFSTQRSRYSTKEEVEFWVHLTAVHRPTNSVYWTMSLQGLVPGSFSRWAVRADSPVEPVADHLLNVFRHYGWPAIQAALDSPGYPPDPAVTWPRSFAAQPSPAARGATSPNLGGLTWALRRTGERDDLFTDISDPDEHVRAGAVSDIGTNASDDARTVAALLNRLEHDPSPAVRSAAARALRPQAGQPQVYAAFQAAAGQDEDHLVRWEARYALRLADLAGAPGMQ